MSKTSFENKLLMKQFYDMLEKIPEPKPIKATSIDGAFREYLTYLFDVSEKIYSYFLVKSFDPAVAATNIDRVTLDNLRFWAQMRKKAPETALKELYFGDKPLSYLKELISVRDPEVAIKYVETAFNITSKTKNPVELTAGICDSMANNIYYNVTKAKEALAEYLNEPEKKRPFFNFFNGRTDR